MTHEPAIHDADSSETFPVGRWLAAHAADSAALLLVLDGEGVIRYANPAARNALEIRNADVPGASFLATVSSGDRGEVRQALGIGEAAEEAPRDLEIRHAGEEGTARTFLWTFTPHRDADGASLLVGSGHDITSLRRERDRHARGEARFRALLTGIQEPILTIDARGVIRGANDAVEGVFGYSPGELEGRNIKLLMGEPHRSTHDGHLAQYRSTGRANTLEGTREVELRHRDGQCLICELSTSKVAVPGETEPWFVSVLRNVTARREAEHRMAESEQRFRAVFDQENRYVCLLEPDGRVIEANAKSLEVMRLSAADVAGIPFWETGWFSRSPGASERIRGAVEQAAAGESVRLELNLAGTGESFTTVDVSIRPIRDESGAVVMLLPEGRDVTELRLARDRETSMLKALATIGESAAILAHEIKNPITAIHYALEAVATELGEDQKAVLDDLVDRLKLLEKMMRRTLSFTRPLELRPKVCEVHGLLEPVLAELAPVAARRNVRIELAVADGCADVTADPHLIGEVFTNLVSNALDAVESEGQILLRVEPGEPGYVCFHVADDGPGVPVSLLASLFKPFFTTKSSGTGLGLALCRKILEEHGGAIEMCSSSMGGACFRVTLPTAG